MSAFDKLIKQIRALSKSLRYDELKKVLECYGYVETSPKSGSSHHTFRKPGETPITIPKDSVIKIAYVKLVREVVEKEECSAEKEKGDSDD